MKKLISLFLTICMLLTFSASLVSCDLSYSDDKSSESQNAKDPQTTTEAAVTTEPKAEVRSGLLLPQSITASEPNKTDEIIPLKWTENSCSFEVEGCEYIFEYDRAARSLSFTFASNGHSEINKDILKFDEKGRVISISYYPDDEREDLMKFAYDGDKMSVTYCKESDAAFPYELKPDFENNTIIAPPFEDPNTIVYFSEYGDVVGSEQNGKKTTFYTYDYDDNGNARSISFYDASLTLGYGEEAMTDAWQRYVMKIVLMYTLGLSLVVFSADVMCVNLSR